MRAVALIRGTGHPSTVRQAPVGTFEVDRCAYAVDDRALACLVRTFSALLQDRRVVEVVLVFDHRDIVVRVTADTLVSIVVVDGVRVTDDVAGLLVSEYIMMGRLRFVGLDSAA